MVSAGETLASEGLREQDDYIDPEVLWFASAGGVHVTMLRVQQVGSKISIHGIPCIVSIVSYIRHKRMYAHTAKPSVYDLKD